MRRTAERSRAYAPPAATLPHDERGRQRRPSLQDSGVSCAMEAGPPVRSTMRDCALNPCDDCGEHVA
eukprot:6040160-Prymnesium_polylepis.1